MKGRHYMKVEAHGIADAVTIELTLLGNNDEIGNAEKISYLHMETKLNRQLHQQLKEQHKNGLIRLESELKDKFAGVQLDFGESKPHKFDEKGTVNFFQRLVGDNKLKSCSDKLHLAVVARFYTYPAV